MRPPPGLAQVEGQRVDVHAHEPPPALDIQPAAELQPVGQRLVLVVKRVLDTGAESLAHRAHQLGRLVERREPLRRSQASCASPDSVGSVAPSQPAMPADMT